LFYLSSKIGHSYWKTLYKTIVISHFEYCAMLLIKIGETQLSKLQKAQNRAIKVILKCNTYTEAEHATSVVVYVHKINYRDCIIIYNIYIFMFKILKNMQQLSKQLRNKL